MVNAYIHFVMSKILGAGKALGSSITHFSCCYFSQGISLWLPWKAGSCARWTLDLPSAAWGAWGHFGRTPQKSANSCTWVEHNARGMENTLTQNRAWTYVLDFPPGGTDLWIWIFSKRRGLNLYILQPVCTLSALFENEVVAPMSSVWC